MRLKRSYVTLVLGILSLPAAAVLGMRVYGTLTRGSANPDSDFVLRLSLTTLAMAVPFAITAGFAMSGRRRGALGVPGKIGIAFAVLSLGLTWVPIRGCVARSRQARSLALEGVAAPLFATVDLAGQSHRLIDHAGEVVLINVWATWCGPCRKEMPELDRLYLSRQDRGLVVFGISTEARDVQRAFVAEKLSVSYPLLTVEGDVPEIYRTAARYPANYLIDRRGRLRSAPSVEQPFEHLAAKVDELLAEAAP